MGPGAQTQVWWAPQTTPHCAKIQLLPALLHHYLWFPSTSRQGSAPPWPGTALAWSHRAPGPCCSLGSQHLPAGVLGLIAGHPCPTLSLPFTPSAPSTESFYCSLNPPQGLCMCLSSCLKQPFPGSQSRLKSYLLGETTPPPSWPNQPRFRLHQLASATSWPSHLFTPGSHLLH